MSQTQTTLSREWQIFYRELPRLLPEHRGEFALIAGDRVLSVHADWGKAMQAGCMAFDFEPFAVLEIQPSPEQEQEESQLREVLLECVAECMDNHGEMGYDLDELFRARQYLQRLFSRE